jgi:hypothetical protein
MVRTKAAEDAALNILEGSTGRGCGRQQAPRGNPLTPPPLHLPVSVE